MRQQHERNSVVLRLELTAELMPAADFGPASLSARVVVTSPTGEQLEQFVALSG